MFDSWGQIWDVPPVPAFFGHSRTPPHLTPLLSSTSCCLHPCTLPSPVHPHLLRPPSSNSLPRTNPGGLSHRWVWAGLTSAWHCLKCLALPPWRFVLIFAYNGSTFYFFISSTVKGDTFWRSNPLENRTAAVGWLKIKQIMSSLKMKFRSEN